MHSNRAARAVVASALIFALAALLTLQTEEKKQRADKLVGFVLEQTEQGLVATFVRGGFPGDRAGLEVGDRILSIGDVPLVKKVDYDVAARTFEPGQPTDFVVERDGRRIILQVTPGVPFPWVEYLLQILVLFSYLALGLLALFQRRRDLRARLLFLFSAAVAIELTLPYDAIGNPTVAVSAMVVFYLLTGLEVAAELHLASVIPRRAPWLARHPWVVPVFYVLGAGVGGTAAVTYLFEDVGGLDAFPWNTAASDRLVEIILPLWALGVAGILWRQAVDARSSQERQQAALVLAGVLPWTIYVVLHSGLSFQGLLEAANQMEVAQDLVLLAYPLAVFVAIFRYQLFDIELMVKRSLVYTSLTGALVLAFYAALVTGSALFSSLVEGGGSVWFISAVTLLLGMLFLPLRRLFQRQIDRRFFPERRALRKRLAALASDLPGLGKLPLMGEHLVGRLRSIFAVSEATLLLADPKSRLLSLLATTREDPRGPWRDVLLSTDEPAVEALTATDRPLPVARLGASGLDRLPLGGDGLVAPLVSQGELIGLILLGPKVGGARFPAEELELLALLGHHVATVFQNVRLFESATYESLTGLLRREAILEALQRELERALRYDRPLTIGMADLDYFKEVNDRYGHLGGDALLKRVAQALASGLRSTDSLGRYGGEEFLLVLPETELAGARVVADKQRALVAETEVTMDDGQPVSVTISIGLASLGDRDLPLHPTVTDLLTLADRALYQAKQAGRNRIHPAAIARVG